MVLDQYTRDFIVGDLGLYNLAEEHQNNILNQLEENILIKINTELVDRLSEDKREELLKLIEAGDSREINAFLRGNITNIDMIIRDVALSVVSGYKSL